MATKRKRGRRHPGVVLIKPSETSRTGWRARFTDPDSGRTVWETLEAVLSTSELRDEWAVRKSRALARRRLELEDGAPRATGTGLDKALDRYFEDHPHLRPGTRGIYRHAADKLARWAGRHGVSSADDLTGPRLVAFRAHLVKEPLKVSSAKGKRGARAATEATRSASSVNRDLRAVGTVLNYVRRLGLLPRLSSDDLQDGLKKLSESVERIDFRKPHELQKLIEAALRHDAATFAETREEHAGLRPLGTTKRYVAIAPVIVAAILTGMRAGELLALEWKDVDLEALDNEGKVVGEIHIGTASKTHRARTVGLEVSPALRTLLVAMHLKSGGKGSVFGVTPGEAKAAEKRLTREFGAPRGSNWQALRRTAGTYLTNSSIYGSATAYHSARQLGHSVEVAERHYLGVVRGIPRDARTLEDAMQITEHVQRVIAAVSAPKIERVRKIG